MPIKVTDMNGGVALTSIQDGDIAYLIRSGADQFAEMETVREYMGGLIPFTKTITSAQLLAGTPVVAIPKAGANTIIEPVGRLFVQNGAGTTAYSGGDAVQLGYEDFSFAFHAIDIDGGDEAEYFATEITNQSPPLSRNLDIVFLFPVPVSGGDYDVTVSGFYRIIDLS